jgi:hypothetical protein
MAPALFKLHLELQKKLVQKRREFAAVRKQHTEDVIAKELKENRRILHSILDANSEIQENNIHLVTIPTGLSGLSTPSIERINKYSEHLWNIIQEAFKTSDTDNPESDQKVSNYDRLLRVEESFTEIPLMRTISDRICSLCKGGCCPSGNEHAYLSVATIRRFMQFKPDFSAETILDYYLTKVSSETIDGACINQTKTGCVLPRKMRSDVCNGYYCDSLKNYQEKQAGNESSLVVIAIQRSNNNWNRFDREVDNEIVNVTFVKEDRINPVEVTFHD